MRPFKSSKTPKISSSHLAGKLIIALVLASSTQLSAQQDGVKAGVESARSNLEQWVQTRRLISKEKRDWNLGEELLKERIDLVKQEIEAMNERIKNAEESLSKLDQEKVKLSLELSTFEKATQAVAATISPLESRINALLLQIPDPIRKKVEPLSRNIPQVGTKEIKLSLGERFQNVVGVLNQVNKFNGEISVFPELRDLGGGKSAEVSNLYIGIGQGYFANDKATAAGVGTALDGKWIWTSKNDAAQEISLAIKIMNDEEGASFVPLPLTVK